MGLRLDRSKRAGPLLAWKVRLFAVGAALGLAGIFLDERWLSGVAIAVLASGALLRFLPGARSTEDEGEGGDEVEG
ncbi:MAG: hypothetical protein AMXMBFR53_04900 [Gemmatimonadota bacterium]